MNKKNFFVRVLINAIAIFFTAEIIKGVNINGFGAALIASLILGIVNAIVRPILIVLTLPINILTLGLFTFVINGISLMIASSFTRGFEVVSIGSAIVASIIITVISSIINMFIE